MSHGTRSASSEWSRGAFAEFTRAQGRNLLLIPPYSACIFAHLQAARGGPAELSPFPPPPSSPPIPSTRAVLAESWPAPLSVTRDTSRKGSRDARAPLRRCVVGRPAPFAEPVGTVD